MSAVKRYPLAITRMARERRMENWAYRRIAVIESHTNIAITYAGTKASTRPRWTPLSGPKAIKAKTTNMPTTTTKASRLCAGPGDKLERMKCCSSGTTAAVFSTGVTLRSRPSGTSRPLGRRTASGGRRTIGVQGELKHRAAGAVRSKPQPAFVRLDDRTADRQAHPHAVGFGSEQRVEDAIGVLRADSCPGVGYRHDYAVGFADLGFDGQDPRLIFRRHRVNGVHDQVEKHLLELDPVSPDLRQLTVRLGLHEYPVLLQVAAPQGKGFLDELVEVE